MNLARGGDVVSLPVNIEPTSILEGGVTAVDARYAGSVTIRIAPYPVVDDPLDCVTDADVVAHWRSPLVVPRYTLK